MGTWEMALKAISELMGVDLLGISNNNNNNNNNNSNLYL